MARFLVVNQIQENYGAHDWDGNGACPQYWKLKGSREYVMQVDDNVLSQMTDAQVEWQIDRLVSHVGHDDEYYRETMIQRGIVPSSGRTPGEAYFDQLLAKGICDEEDRPHFQPREVRMADLA